MDDRPDELLLSEVLRHSYGELPAADARVKVSRLTLIRTAGFDAVIGSDGNGKFLDVVAVQVPEMHGEAAVGVPRPAFEDGLNLLTGVVAEMIGLLLGLGVQVLRHADERSYANRDSQTS